VDLELLRGLQAELHGGRRRDPPALIDLDQRIHRAIYQATHNPFLVETLETYYAHALRIWMLALARTDLGSAVGEHTSLLAAIIRGDGGRGAALMRTHVEAFETAMRDALLET
jgi:DNA-binding GntR family transcriptional regulator